jgi:osmotically-inducible protein OsmY
MVRVDSTTTDRITAWRIRDALASHPTLGGGTADICVVADYSSVVLQGWAMDSKVHDLAMKMATRAAGRRTVSMQLAIRNCRHVCSVTRLC